MPDEANGLDLNDVWFVLNGSGAIVQTLAAAPTVQLDGNADRGEFLIAGNSLTLYIFTPDQSGVSNCNGGCAVAWPPLMVAGGESGCGCER